jgi:hypothetical protein
VSVIVIHHGHHIRSRERSSNHFTARGEKKRPRLTVCDGLVKHNFSLEEWAHAKASHEARQGNSFRDLAYIKARAAVCASERNALRLRVLNANCASSRAPK